MIRLLHRNEIVTARWDECIELSNQQQAFYHTWYLDATTEKWAGLVYGDYEAVLPLAIRSKLGIDYLYQPFFTRHFGVVFRKGFDTALAMEMLNSIPVQFRYVDFALHARHDAVPEGWSLQPKSYQELDLSPTYTDIRRSYHDNLVRNLKKAERAQVSVHYGYSPSLLVEQFRLHQSGLQKTFNDEDYRRLLKLMQAASDHCETICVSARAAKGETLAAIFLLRTGNRWLYLKGFSTETAKKCGAMAFLFDHFIQHHCGENRVLDFGGSSVKTVARFYQGFGSSDCVYLHLRVNRLPKALRWIKR